MSNRVMFDRFSDEARQVLACAQQEALRFVHSYIGTEHLLLGLLHVPSGTAAEVLESLGVGLEKVRSSVEQIIGRGERIVHEELELTPRAKKVIQLAADEAHRLEHGYIGTEHILLGLVREGGGIAAGVLKSLGVSHKEVWMQTVRVLGQRDPSFVEDPTNLAAGTCPLMPPEAVKLVAEGESALVCDNCHSRSPLYFRHCFNCGGQLIQ